MAKQFGRLNAETMLWNEKCLWFAYEYELKILIKKAGLN